ncbi:hypothetical protein E2562_019712 [Oryza meyeriana var. granulata]|uniref:Uncharacterized protein n=1 Tax=Oryza meyeriana var. granulata TaxID=110450 RepID=A0A6G1C7U6_9ORYZ|nr:hypothetical protein E2562_019712 [Oryza meyeriana var. granulata]
MSDPEYRGHEFTIAGQIRRIVLKSAQALQRPWRHKGISATLQVDEEQLEKHLDAIWKALEEVDGERSLFRLHFKPIKQQVMKPDDKEAVEPKIQKDVTEDGTREKIST